MAKKQEEELDDTKGKALALALSAIEKAQGKGSILKGKQSLPDVEFLPSGSTSVDRVLGGGWGRGRIHEIMGPPSSGKSTLCLHAVAESQKLGETVAYIDMEHALDFRYAENLGVDTENLLLSQPNNGEDALEIVDTLTSSGAVSLIIVDSVAALVPRKELEGDMGDSNMGLQARLMSQAMRKLTAKTHKTNTTLIFINQIRMKMSPYGNPEVGAGGEALKFYASQRLDVRRIGGVKDGEELVANTTRIKCIKNKLASPFKECEVEIRYGEGIDVYFDVLNLALAKGIITKGGAWFSYNEQTIAQGTANTKQWLKDNPEEYEKIKQLVVG